MYDNFKKSIHLSKSFLFKLNDTIFFCIFYHRCVYTIVSKLKNIN